MIRDGLSRSCLEATNRHVETKKRRRRVRRLYGSLVRRLAADRRAR
jgi:hypothetical protein